MRTVARVSFGYTNPWSKARQVFHAAPQTVQLPRRGFSLPAVARSDTSIVIQTVGHAALNSPGPLSFSGPSLSFLELQLHVAGALRAEVWDVKVLRRNQKWREPRRTASRSPEWGYLWWTLKPPSAHTRRFRAALLRMLNIADSLAEGETFETPRPFSATRCGILRELGPVFRPQIKQHRCRDMFAYVSASVLSHRCPTYSRQPRRNGKTSSRIVRKEKVECRKLENSPQLSGISSVWGNRRSSDSADTS